MIGDNGIAKMKYIIDAFRKKKIVKTRSCLAFDLFFNVVVELHYHVARNVTFSLKCR